MLRLSGCSSQINFTPVQSDGIFVGLGMIQSAGVKLSIKEVIKCIGGVSLSYFSEHCLIVFQRRITTAPMARIRTSKKSQILAAVRDEP
jgi:hypothetical protein